MKRVFVSLRKSFFNITLELLKEKTTGKTIADLIPLGLLVACFVILIMFIQLIGMLFEKEVSIANGI